MRLLIAISLFVATTLGCASTNAPTPPQPAPSSQIGPATYTIVDITPDFLAFYDQAHGLPVEEQLRRFRADIVTAHPSLFVANTLAPGSADFDLDSRLRKWLPTLPSRIESIRRLSTQVHANIQQHEITFRRAFPDLAFDGVVYFTVSVDAFDGAVRDVDGARALLFGLDTVARVHGDADIAPLFHHELFHVYHAQRVPALSASTPSVGLALWVEGLAVHVARTLNPTASWRQLTLTDDMVAQGELHLPGLATAFLPHLTATDADVYRATFLGANSAPGFTPRVGYFLGMKVAAHVQGERPLREVVSLWDVELHDAIVEALETFASKAPNN